MSRIGVTLMKIFHSTSLPITLPNNDTIIQKDHMILLSFASSRRILSTSAWNGGIREDITCVFNYDLSHGKTIFCEPLEPTMAGHMRRLGELAGLPVANSGLCTAAQMKNVCITQETWDTIVVTAIVTAGIDENGGRAGDPASWQEKDYQLGIPVGTINLLLHFNCDLLPGTLTTALLTATEAKAAAIQELQLPSKVSSGIATGSGTDGAILICDSQSTTCLTDCGKHSKLGEMVGKTVFHAVKEALFLQTGASPDRLHHAIRLLERFGFHEKYVSSFFPTLSVEQLHTLCQKEEIWSLAAMYAHLMDLENWNIMTHEQAIAIANKLYPLEEKSYLEALIAYMKEQE